MEKQVLFSNLTLDFKISVILLSGAAAEHLLAPRERVNLDDANVLKGKRGRSAAREEGERDRGRRREREVQSQREERRRRHFVFESGIITESSGEDIQEKFSF